MAIRIRCIRMGTKNVRLEEDVYERIKSKKQEGETFSEAVERLIGGSSLLDLVGILSDEEAEEMREVIDEVDADAIEDVDDVIGQFEDVGE